MKKIILLLLLTISIVTLAQEPATWDYPIKPGSEEWLNIKDYSKRLELLNIPQDELTNISTNELVKICVDYPQMGLIYTKNDLFPNERLRSIDEENVSISRHPFGEM